jgi:hypothetical protein
MSEAAEHRPRDCAQHHARAKSRPGLGTGRNGKGQSDHAKDGNRPGVHDRSPADCRTGRVWQSSPRATFQHWESRQLCRFEPREPSWKSNRPPPDSLIAHAWDRREDRPSERSATCRPQSERCRALQTAMRLNCRISISVAFLPQSVAARGVTCFQAAAPVACQNHQGLRGRRQITRRGKK